MISVVFLYSTTEYALLHSKYFLSQVRKGLSLNLQFNATFEIEDHFNYSDCPYDWLKVGKNQAFRHIVSVKIFAKICVQLKSINDCRIGYKYWLGTVFHLDIFLNFYISAAFILEKIFFQIRNLKQTCV